jgi:ATP-dependent Clp protease ATP-binding subunit ClpC
MTSNLGAETAGKSLGFGAGAAAALDRHYRAAATAFFRPELVNRLDQIVPYRALDRAVVARLAARLLAAALAREGLVRRGVVVDVDRAVAPRLAELGFDARLGARPLKRAVETHVIAPLARLVARLGARSPGRLTVVVDAAGDLQIVAAGGNVIA